ncbi:hypothetical protein BD626DRAFT_509616 [Schizophyllum amplum]|uniref:Uncharacterized protein n=1 Tax=Schizophyllum amplum TaxID=97359 RepID=A0A550C2N7_9AGAR|nr:hypothetical protein BD626DRAFT_509616 [Auriculariopsis ampla]
MSATPFCAILMSLITQRRRRGDGPCAAGCMQEFTFSHREIFNRRGRRGQMGSTRPHPSRAHVVSHDEHSRCPTTTPSSGADTRMAVAAAAMRGGQGRRWTGAGRVRRLRARCMTADDRGVDVLVSLTCSVTIKDGRRSPSAVSRGVSKRTRSGEPSLLNLDGHLVT